MLDIPILGMTMKILNMLFESSEVVKEKIKEIEKQNIDTLRKSHLEILELLKKSVKKKPKVIHVHEESYSKIVGNFPVDHRIR